MASIVGESSLTVPSSSLFSGDAPPPPPPHPPSEKFVCFAVSDIDNDKMEWYAFDVSDDPAHNQPLPPPLPPLPPAYRRLILHSYLIPFHEDDDDGAINLKPIAAITADGGKGWSIMGGGANNKNPHTLYHICYRYCSLLRGEIGGPMERIDLTGTGNWEMVPGMPNRVATKPICHVVDHKVYCLGGIRREGPWAMAYDPALNKWESLPNPPYRPRSHTVFTATMDDPHHGGPCIVVPRDGVLQVYLVNKKQWKVEEKFNCNFGRLALSPSHQLGGRAVVVEKKLYWYGGVNDQCLVGYDLETHVQFQVDLPLHDHTDYTLVEDGIYQICHASPSLAHLGGSGNDNMFCLCWVSELLARPKQKPEGYISRLHCMKFRVNITRSGRGIEFTPSDVSISIQSCQSYLVDGLKTFHGAVAVDGHLGCKVL